jgi:hypothetical protein
MCAREVLRRVRTLLALAVPVGAAAAAVTAGCNSDPAGGGSYTAPAASREGCPRPYARSSPWNTPVGRRPTYAPDGRRRVAAIGGELTSDPTQYTYPVYDVTRKTPVELVRIHGWYSNVRGDGRTLRLQRGGSVRLPIPAGAASAAGSDSQMILVDWRSGDEWGAWKLRERSDGSWEAENGYHYNIRWSGVPPRDPSGRPFVSRGAGVPYFAGLVRPCELARRRIGHALAFAYDYPSAEYVYPATKSDGKGTGPSAMPEGSRLQLDPRLSARRIRAWGCKGPCFVIAKALQRYGMYVIDNSGRPKVMLEYEGTARWGGSVDSETVSPIPLSAFKIVKGNHQRRRGRAGL